MVAYLEKTDGNAEFHEIIDFLTRSSIHYALTVSPVVSTTFVEQFWMSAKSKIINNVRYITAKVAGKPVNISEASIRSDLLFDDADGIDSLHNQAIFDAIQLMGFWRESWRGFWWESWRSPVIQTGRKSAKSTPTAHTIKFFDDVDCNDAWIIWRQTDALHVKGVSTEDQYSTRSRPDEGTAEPKDGTSKEILLCPQQRCSEMMRPIAEFLVSMSQNKAKQKGVEIKDAKDSDRPRATSTRSVLTLKPLPKIDPKDKGKKVLEEEAESDAESEGVDEAERKLISLLRMEK
ncbi:hypothetical protein Tco_1377321 [Tanacetum coccineum]